MIIFFIFLATLWHYVLFDKALNCLKVNSETLTLEEINKCIDIILQSELKTFILLEYHPELIPADRLDECRQRVKSNVL